MFNNSTCAGLNIGLPFAALGGVGNLILGNIENGVGQLILTLGVVIVAIIFNVCWKGSTKVRVLVDTHLLVAWLCGVIWSIEDGVQMLQGG